MIEYFDVQISFVMNLTVLLIGKEMFLAFVKLEGLALDLW